MKFYSVNEIAKLSGKDRRTISKRLEGVEAVEGKYDLGTVLDAFEAHGARISDKLDLNQETARLRSLQADALQRQKDAETGAVRGSMPMADVHKAAQEITWAICVAQDAAVSAKVPQLSPREADWPWIAEELEDTFRTTLGSIVAGMPDERIPKAVRDGMVEMLAHRTSGGHRTVERWLERIKTKLEKL